MERKINGAIAKYGGRAKLVSVECLPRLQEEIAKFRQQEKLNNFQNWIVSELYSFELPKTSFPIRSVILIAEARPGYAKVILNYHGKSYVVFSLIAGKEKEINSALAALIATEGYHIVPADRLPFKRLAVQSGLAVYGRNNITYVNGMGSHLSYQAFYSDLPCEKFLWREVCVADICERCMACVNHCPTGAISKEHFLIDVSRCFSALNEAGGEFPQWLPKSAHHTAYDCLKCQICCPMNIGHNPEVPEEICFNQNETERVLKGAPYDDLPDDFSQRIKRLGFDKWPDGLPRNLRTLFQLMDEGYAPKLY